MSAYIEQTGPNKYNINTPYGHYTRNSLVAARLFCQDNGFKPVYVERV